MTPAATFEWLFFYEKPQANLGSELLQVLLQARYCAACYDWVPSATWYPGWLSNSVRPRSRVLAKSLS